MMSAYAGVTEIFVNQFPAEQARIKKDTVWPFPSITLSRGQSEIPDIMKVTAQLAFQLVLLILQKHVRTSKSITLLTFLYKSGM